MKTCLQSNLKLFLYINNEAICYQKIIYYHFYYVFLLFQQHMKIVFSGLPWQVYIKSGHSCWKVENYLKEGKLEY